MDSKHVIERSHAIQPLGMLFGPMAVSHRPAAPAARAARRR
jgi:hypothetical protein